MFWDRLDPLAFPSDYLHERYYSDGRLLDPKIQHQLLLSHGLCDTTLFCKRHFLYVFGDAENLSRGIIIRTIKNVYFDTEIVGTHLHHLPWPQKKLLNQ